MTHETYRHNAYCTLPNEYRAPRVLSCNKGIPVLRVLCHSHAGVTEVTGKGMGILQNLQKFRVRVRKCYRTHRSSGQVKMLYPYPGYLRHWRTERTEVPGTGVNVLQNLHKFFVG